MNASANGENQPAAGPATAAPAIAGPAATGPATAGPVVCIHGLNHRFGQGELSQQVLFDIDLEINPGEFVLLTGPSGCGKTTLLTLIGALRSVQEGTLHVLGREMRGLTKEGLIAARRDIGFIFQAHNLLDALTAGENVSLALDLKSYTPDRLYDHGGQLLGIAVGDSDAKNFMNGVARNVDALARGLATGLLTHLLLGERVDHKPNQLSGGQKQRVAIARALVNHPRLVLADEPTAALDKVSSIIVIELLKKLTQMGSTIIVVTHDSRIMDRGDRVVTMKDGRIQSNILVDETVRICLFLQNCPLFSGLSPSRLVEVAQQVRKEVHPPGATIIRQGEIGDKFYMIKEGAVEISMAEDVASKVVATLGSGQFFGEIALLEDQPRNATAVARERVELYALRKEDFLHARAAFEPMRDELMKVFAQRFRR